MFGGAGWAAFSLTNAASAPASEQILFLCLLVLIFYELAKAGGARRGAEDDARACFGFEPERGEARKGHIS